MKSKLRILFVILSTFMFTSCGDSKDKLIDDTIDYMEEMAVAIEEGDESKIKELEEEDKELTKRAEELGFDINDKDALSDDQQKRMKAALNKMFAAGFKTMGQDK